MSWSIHFIGKPDGIVKALYAYNAKLDGISKQEFGEALPNLVGIVGMNFTKQEGQEQPILEVMGNGHAYAINGDKQTSYCSISVKHLPGTPV